MSDLNCATMEWPNCTRNISENLISISLNKRFYTEGEKVSLICNEAKLRQTKDV